MYAMIDLNFINLSITILLGIVVPLAIVVIKLWAIGEDYKKFKLLVESKQAKEEERREEEMSTRQKEHTAILLQLNSIGHQIETLSKQK
jgi:hypothetical protein